VTYLTNLILFADFYESKTSTEEKALYTERSLKLEVISCIWLSLFAQLLPWIQDCLNFYQKAFSVQSVFCWKHFWSNDFSAKWTFRSSDHLCRKKLSVKSFRRNDWIFILDFRSKDPYPFLWWNDLLMKSDQMTFFGKSINDNNRYRLGQMTFWSNGVLSNGVWLGGVSVK
jgi:hypothetical protein